MRVFIPLPGNSTQLLISARAIVTLIELIIWAKPCYSYFDEKRKIRMPLKVTWINAVLQKLNRIN